MRRFLILLWCAASLSSASELPAREPDVIGKAYNQASGKLVYSEYHFCSADDRRCEIHYQDNLGEVFARKDLDYSGSELSPGLRMRDFRHDLDLQLDQQSDPDLVVDAGFDNYVRLRWNQLLQGEEVRFPFLIAGRDKPLAMRAGPGMEAECDPRRVCLQIELDSWLLGMLVDPYQLTYDRGSRRLVQFSGTSNIKDHQGQLQQVHILYRYPEAGAGPKD